MKKVNTVEAEVLALLRRSCDRRVTARDIPDFRSKLQSKGIPTHLLEGVLRGMRNRGQIRLRKLPGGNGTEVRLLAA